jgi:aminocarboxymuconate-semialdehyde decarboxylase
MDAMAVDLEVVDKPLVSQGQRLAAEIVKGQNEKLTELCASKPDRFMAFVSFTLYFRIWLRSSSRPR